MFVVSTLESERDCKLAKLSNHSKPKDVITGIAIRQIGEITKMKRHKMTRVVGASLVGDELRLLT